ncbi:zinc ribbon domain-containing protein [Geobacillus stearothermophilus]|uniref:zinc ribbon domain-containing protein n=1 Tax=Geobacillus stearothermophilus TaxID=1422 RepID=UPI00399D2AE6
MGLVRCGHCGNPLCTTYNKKKYVRKDGTEYVKREAKYRCSGKAQKKVDCDGQTLYSPKKIEGVVLDVKADDKIPNIAGIKFPTYNRTIVSTRGAMVHDYEREIFYDQRDV